MTERPAPQDLESEFKNWVKLKGIEVVLFDLDDTLIDTNTTFALEVDRFISFCQSRLPEVDNEVFRTNFRRIDSESFATLGIHPKKWDHVARELCKLYKDDSLIEGLAILQGIYNLVPDLHEGVVTVERLSKLIDTIIAG